MNFKEFRHALSEATQDKTYKVGKYKAVIKKEGTKFVAYLDGDKFDTFKSVKEAQKALKDFVALLGTQ